jgi:hypothetical protein
MAEPDLKTQAGRLQWAREQYVTADGGRLLSPRKAAQHFGWNENTYKSHESGIRQGEGLKLKHAEKYARALNVDIAWLMTGRGSPYLKRA